MAQHLVFISGSILVLSLLAFVGVLGMGMREELLREIVFVLVSFAAGAMFGGAFLHLIPKTAALYGFTSSSGLVLLGGIFVFLIVDTFIHWHHHHFREGECEECVEPVTYTILFGDVFHNLVDGIVIAAAYMSGFSVGLAATLAVALHKLPKELGDFGVLVHGGLSVRRAVTYNFLASLVALFGAAAAVIATGRIAGFEAFLLPFAAGSFVYIAGTDLLPEFKEESEIRKAAIQTVSFLTGIGVMYLLKQVIPAIVG
ncbi:MAG: ZIP family metal transporter [Candidatus Nanohaloarchaea archaeon]|nr:ZIP family metal transporter [Candidatus Nanohaloarchaea archaeon]